MPNKDRTREQMEKSLKHAGDMLVALSQWLNHHHHHHHETEAAITAEVNRSPINQTEEELIAMRPTIPRSPKLWVLESLERNYHSLSGGGGPYQGDENQIIGMQIGRARFHIERLSNSSQTQYRIGITPGKN